MLHPISWKPRIFVYPQFLSSPECLHLIELAKPKLRTSGVIDVETGQIVQHESRTAESMSIWDEDEIVLDIQNRIAVLTQIPFSHIEKLQIARYAVGGEYRPHYDFLDPELTDKEALAHYGQRVATIIIYLNHVEEGGETLFPNAGLKVHPNKGDLLIFYNLMPNGDLDRLTLHGGAPVLKGEKWIAVVLLLAKPCHHR